MPNIETARLANNILTKEKLGHSWSEFMPASELFDGIHGTVHYIGCGNDYSTLFLFENASKYVHQDRHFGNLQQGLKRMDKDGIISDFTLVEMQENKTVSQFKHNGKAKTFIEIYGPPLPGMPPQYHLPPSKEESEALKTHVKNIEASLIIPNPGDVAFTTPDEIKNSLDAIYFFGMPYPNSIKIMQINILPYLKMEGLFIGPCFKSKTEELGLEFSSDSVYKKVKQFGSEEIQSIINFTIDQYRNILEEELDS